ncbi:MAG TPA: polysaccharide pyruvyl transferase family protein [Bacteroides mediterraneensis]|uniref:polysaccharide pyruvyl transferase family protein n=1 Tax=Bacteroides mediterraneensis TaxID=1841856 RepID=UPI0026F2696A|nr:polysaccharide pyruvyl transferase family protein [Bacteroides mediterraneensis]HJH64122.1 polysaccharide pyruvyl transferase family protein [Bacteroides mediterraneensis]
MLRNEEKKCKVGAVIIMHPGHNNYGTSLQGLATVKFLQKEEISFDIIRYNKKRTLWDIISTGPFLLMSGALKSIQRRKYKEKSIKEHPVYRELLKIRTTKIQIFKDKYFEPLCKYYTGYKNLHKGSLNYDVVFVGSDQVWSPLSLYSKFYNLLFVDKSVPTFSYASSFGVSNILKWQIKGTRRFLNKLDLIGVREIRGKEIVDSLSNKKATVVVDPTLLLCRKDWDEIADMSLKNYSEPYIFCYILGQRDSIREQINKLRNKTGYKVVFLRHVDDYYEPDEKMGDYAPYDIDPIDFINLIRNASYVITDSFHCTIFSIIFHKQFSVFYRVDPSSPRSTHSRIQSLLMTYGLIDRLGENGMLDKIDNQIDYKYVDNQINRLRENSIYFFRKGLNLPYIN